MRYRRIPDETIRRLPLYLRNLLLLKEKGERRISSGGLGEIVHLNSAVIRKDFSYFGAFGTPGVGYYIDTLVEHIRAILKLDRRKQAALVGAGKIGMALLDYPGFASYGLEIAAVFDNDPGKIGKRIGKVKVENASRLHTLKDRGIRLAIVAVPLSAAQGTASTLVKAGIGGILNLAPCHIEAPKKVKVVNIDIAMELGSLQYYI